MFLSGYLFGFSMWFNGVKGSWLVCVVFEGSVMIFKVVSLFFMYIFSRQFHGFRLAFMLFSGRAVSWFLKVVSWFFMGFGLFSMVPGWFFMVFFQNVPAPNCILA